MPRNASTGVYTPPANSWNPATPDTVISSADWNALQADMATALNHAPSTTRALHPTTGQVQDGAFIWGGTAGGTADALTLTLTPPITSYAEGLTVRFRVGPATNNTTTPTLAINGLAAHTITRYDNTPLAAGDLPANAVVEVVYNNSAWRLLITPQSQVQGNDGTETVTSAASVVLTSFSKRVQVVNITTEGQSVFLPDAKTLTVGGPRFYVRNDGVKTFALRSSNANQVINNGFDNTNAWTLGTGWAISGGVATKTPGSATDIEQTLPTDSGVAYRVTFTVTSVSGGSVRVVLKGGGPDVLGTPRSAAGTYTEILISNGNTTLALRADASFAGAIDNVSLTLMNPPLLAGMPPGAVAECVLEENNTIQGKWHVLGRNTMSAAPIVNTILPASLTQTAGLRTLKMSETLSLHFAQNASGNPFVFAVDYDAAPPVIGTPILISAVSALVTQAFRLSDTKAFVVIDQNLNNCFIVSVSGTTCSVSESATADVLKYGHYTGPPLIATLGVNNDLFVGIDSSNNPNIRAQAVNASGNVPAAGSPVNISTTGVSQSYSAISIFRVDDNRAVAFYIDDSGTPGSPFSIRAVVLTLTGTSIATGTSAGINDVINDINAAHGVVCQISNTSYVWVYGSGNNVQAVAISVSGTSVTFGTPITVTTFPSAPEVRFILGNRFNPVIFALSGNRVFVAFRRATPREWRCSILTVSGLSVSAGPIFYLGNQSSPLFFPHNDEHTVLVQRDLESSGSTGRVIGLDHEATSIAVSGFVIPLGIVNPSRNVQATLSNGLICVKYDTMGANILSNFFFSSRMEVFKPSPNGTPKALGHFTIPGSNWDDMFFPVEVSSRRLAFLGREAFQEGADTRVRLCIMEVVVS